MSASRRICCGTHSALEVHWKSSIRAYHSPDAVSAFIYSTSASINELFSGYKADIRGMLLLVRIFDYISKLFSSPSLHLCVTSAGRDKVDANTRRLASQSLFSELGLINASGKG